MKENYQKQLDALLSALPPEEKPRLLLQSCCGPCSSYVLEYLTRYFRVTVLYYNPNIQPRDEYDRRLYWQRELIRQLPTPEPVDLLACDYDGQRYIDAVRGLEREPEGGARCTVCFRLRLEETARQARLALRREGSEQRIELFLIVFFHKRHLPDSIAHPRAEYQCGP